MKHNQSIWYIVAVLCSTAFLQSTPVLAGKQIYPGSMCVSLNRSQPIPRLDRGGIFNHSTFMDMKVDCPILHQNFNTFSGNDLDDADIGVIDNHTSRRVVCWLASNHQIGTKTITGGGSFRFTRDFDWPGERNLDFNATRRHPESSYHIRCTIPRKQAFRSPSGITYYSGED